jgi:hypothetical protein
MSLRVSGNNREIDLETMTMKKKLSIPMGHGSISLAEKDGSLYKKALLCRTGSFDGVYGPIKVTSEMLSGIAKRYNEERSNPQNENDFAPVLKNHDRNVDNVFGRVLADMSVESWEDPSTGESELGLFATIRIDDEHAIKKVESGKYAHLSISFDEENFEFYEVSFVGVEAARRSIVLSKKTSNHREKIMGRKTSLAKKHASLMGVVKSNLAARKVQLELVNKNVTSLESEIKEIQAKANTIALAIKKNQIKGHFNAFIREGKMNPAELKSLKIESLASLESGALDIVLASYGARPVSVDVRQIGQQSTKVENVQLSKEEMKEAIKIQRAGKKVKLEKEDSKEDDKNVDDSKKEFADDKAEPMSADELKACLEELAGHHAKLSECISKIQAMSDAIKKVSNDDEKEEKELEEKEDDKKEEKEKETELSNDDDENEEEGEE